MTKKILILASNSNDDLPNIDTEIRDLKAAIKRNKNFIVEIEPAVQAEDIQKHFHEYNPYIVHFCGHGAGKEGLVLDKGKLLSNNALSGLFKIFGEEIECVLLNACTTEIQAETIGEYIPYVVGTSREILDRAAYLFAVGFYEALGYGESIERCYELGCNAVEIGLNKVQLLPLENSKTPRKFEIVDEVKTSAQDESSNIILLKVNSAVNSPIDTPSSIPSRFQKTILEEVERKNYYDNLRNVLEKFGQTTIEREKPISKFEYEQRQILVNEVKEFWIEGFLKPSLYFNTAVDVTEDDPSGQILRPLDRIEVIPFNIDDSYEELHKTDITGQINDGKTLLILGNPGSGKTIALLQLAERLIQQTQKDMTKPIPVVFNLSSWGEKQQPLEEWLIEELKDKYQVPKNWSVPWIKEQQLTLLLDGLDEVKENNRNACIRAINKFIADDHLETEIVVCSRIKDYEALSERLLLSSAICIQPLSKQQLLDFLKNADDSLLGLKTVIEQDKEIAEFAQSPLILNMMTWTYHGWSAEQCQKQFRIAENREFNLFESYIEKQLNRENKAHKYSQEEVIMWLSYLSKIMIQESIILFLIEKIQPTWVTQKKEKNKYIFNNSLILGALFTITAVITLLLQSLLSSYTDDEIFLFMVIFSICGFIWGRVGTFKKIRLFNILNWSWKTFIFKTKSLIPYFLIAMGIIFIIYRNDLHSFYFMIKNMIINLVWYIPFLGVNSQKSIQTNYPNQGIWKTVINSALIGIFSSIIFFLIGIISIYSDTLYSSDMGTMSIDRIVDNFSMMLPFFFPFSLSMGLSFGGYSCIRHFSIRQFLYRKGLIPWNYAYFLDYATQLKLIKKVGGGYIFYHRMLMEHFAQRDRVFKESVSVVPRQTSQPVRQTNTKTSVNSSNISNNISRSSTIKSTPKPITDTSKNSKTSSQTIINTTTPVNNPVPNFIICGSCNHQNPKTGKFCIKCGQKLIHPSNADKN